MLVGALSETETGDDCAGPGIDAGVAGLVTTVGLTLTTRAVFALPPPLPDVAFSSFAKALRLIRRDDYLTCLMRWQEVESS